MRSNQDKETDARKRLVLCTLAVLVLVLMVIGVTYAVYDYTEEGVQENVIRTGSIEFTYKENTNGILITDAKPMSDEEGKAIPASGTNIAQGYFDFTITARLGGKQKINYEISGIDTSPVESKLDPEYVKVYLTDTSTGEEPVNGYGESNVPTYGSLENSIDGKGKALYNGEFSDSGTRKFRLRLWVAENYPLLYKGNKETFSMKVNVNVA